MLDEDRVPQHEDQHRPQPPAVVADAGSVLVAAKAAGLQTSIDLNYRVKLWTPAEAGKIAGGNYMRIFRAAVG